MENNYNVTISLHRYDELSEQEFKLNDILDTLDEAICKIERLNWSKEELDVPEYLIPIMKKYCCYEYRSKLKELKNKEDQI